MKLATSILATAILLSGIAQALQELASKPNALHGNKHTFHRAAAASPTNWGDLIAIKTVSRARLTGPLTVIAKALPTTVAILNAGGTTSALSTLLRVAVPMYLARYTRGLCLL
ncbi:hypothetical protein V2G26_001705 [Clonostachys chloroleuca]